MNEPPKNNLGCNAWFLKALQPNCRIMLRYVLVFQTGLRHHYIGYIIQGFNRLVYVVCMPFLFDD